MKNHYQTKFKHFHDKKNSHIQPYVLVKRLKKIFNRTILQVIKRLTFQLVTLQWKKFSYNKHTIKNCNEWIINLPMSALILFEMSRHASFFITM